MKTTEQRLAELEARVEKLEAAIGRTQTCQNPSSSEYHNSTGREENLTN
ncbi:hypothetical protein P4S93_06885 [Aneurinibacillus thermoaerophilus]|nr:MULTISPECIES: hypothetical protein [Aneurinibacillus]MED0677188.1 hypothetical protein [Aneurinibacillus thermoaerophilus]MED0758824.1 hypothetical protein [Aneurinibacillus thermoaerophilus]MED0760499.1 hypothetical protein [Aneurinibacillus thermoaerophilus]